MISFLYITFLIVSIIFLIQGIFYALNKGYYYKKMAEKKSDKYIRNIGILFLILGSLGLIISIYELFIVV